MSILDIRPSVAELLAPTGDPALYLFNDPEEARTPSLASINRLMDQGVSLSAINSPWPLHAARVQFDPDAGRYRPLLLGSPVFIVAVIAEEGVIDAVAWEPRSGRLASRLGVGAMLGEWALADPAAGRTGLPIRVWRSPLSWLRAGRQGVVIVDPIRAAHRLAGLTLAGEDEGHDATLAAQLVVPPPTFASSRKEAHVHALAA
jgi:hypothetical protein